MNRSRAAATAAAIEDAALDLALERGYDNVTVDLVCEKVGISQRTFFNHFPTKDDALLGRNRPQLDERAARRFVLADGPLLIDALTLIQLPVDGTPHRITDRMRVVSASPPLLIKQMGRIAAIEHELIEIISLRLEHAHPGMPAEEREREASLTTHMLAGILRWIATQAEAHESAGTDLTDVVAQARATLERTLRDSSVSEPT